MPFKRIHRRSDVSRVSRLKLLSNLSRLVLFGFIGALILFTAIIIFFLTQVPSPDQLTNRVIAASTKIYDKNGELLYDIFQNQNRTPVKLNDIPIVIRQATISIEDKDFYKHKGFSPIGIGRAFFGLVVHRQIEGGGSTLTQQLIKNALLTGERSFVRKIKELILSIQVEQNYTKDQILEMYLNEIPYGGTAYGIESAANLYFGKYAKDLTLAESAYLAGLPQRPSVYGHYGSKPDSGLQRQAEVLRRMVEDGYISKSQADGAKAQELIFRTSQTEEGIKAPHFVLYVKQKLIEQYGDKLVEQGGLRVTTTIDYKLQEQVQNIVKDEVEKLKDFKVGNGAAVVMDPKTGQILAMVGSKDYFATDYDGNFNAALALRQPGSATKPINYAQGFIKGYTPASVIMDVKTEFPGGDKKDYVPVNYDGQFHGPVQIRYGLGNSYNIPAVKMLAINGVKNVMDLGFRMGLTSWEPTDENVNNAGLSLTLGGREVRLLDLTTSFGVFAVEGKRHDAVSILKVADAKGKTLYEYRESEGTKIFDEGVAFLISDILADNGARSAAFGSNSILNIPGKTVSVKTGTTDEKRDNWAVGFTPSVVTGVWVGNNDNSVMNPAIASGVTGASPIWQKIMIAALKDKPDEKPRQSGNVIQLEIDGLMGGKPKEGSPTRKEYFIKGSEPTSEAWGYQKHKVCKANPHRLANEGEDSEEKDVIVLKEDDPTGADKWQPAIDQWVLTASDSRFVGVARGCSGVPGFSGGGTGGVISIVNVNNGANVPRVFDVLAKANSPFGVKKVSWQIDGAQKSTQTAEPFALHVEFPQGDKGSHTISVTLEDNNGGTFTSSIGVIVAL